MTQPKTDWGEVADWYQQTITDEDSYQQQVILPNLLRLLGKVSGREILDLACGSGFFAHILAQNGAKITGVDLGQDLIKLARESAGSNEEYFITSADDLSVLNGKKFDKIICILAIQNIKNLDQVFAAVEQKLQSNGSLILVLNHPCFRIPQFSDWNFDEQKKVQSRKVERYMSETEISILMQPSKEQKSQKTYSFHRPLQVYFKSLVKNNLQVMRLEEWISHKKSGNGPRQKAEDVARKEIPMFMCLEIKKMF